MGGSIKRLGQAFFTLQESLFPPRCLSCDGLLDAENHFPQAMLCQDCVAEITPIPTENVAGSIIGQSSFFADSSSPSLEYTNICQICGIPISAEGAVKSAKEPGYCCYSCFIDPPTYTYCRSLFTYNKVMKKLIKQLKFHQVPLSFSTLQTICKDVIPTYLIEDIGKCDYIVPVPLHPMRLRGLRGRGFNQSVLLAHLLFEKTPEKITSNLLKRVKNTTAQSQLNRRKRRTNLSKAFAINPNMTLKNSSVCLIDDVFTTGSTVNECSKFLLSNGCSNVFIITLARVIFIRRKNE